MTYHFIQTFFYSSPMLGGDGIASLVVVLVDVWLLLLQYRSICVVMIALDNRGGARDQTKILQL